MAANRSTTAVQSSTPSQAIKELATFVSSKFSTTIRENFPNSSSKAYIPTTDPYLTGSTNYPQTYKDATFVNSIELEEHTPASPSESTENFDFELNSVKTFQSLPTENSFLQDNEKNLSSSYNTSPLYISLIIGILLLLFIILLILVLLRYKTVLKDRFVGKSKTHLAIQEV